MFCKKCGTQLDGGMEFCPTCGEKNAVEAAAVEVAEEVVAAPQQTEVTEEAQAEAVAPAESAVTNAVAPKKSKGLSKNVILIGAAAAAVVLVLLVCVVVAVSSGGKKQKLIYLKDNEILAMKGKNSYVVGDKAFDDEDDMYNFSSYIQLSEDGKYIYYPQKAEYNSFDLYYNKVDSKKDGTKIASGVSAYYLIDNNKLIYLNDDADKEMYLYNLKKDEKQKVASDVSWMRLSSDHKQIFWKANSSDDSKIYVCDVAMKKGKTKLDSDVENVYYARDSFDKIVYTKEGSLYVMVDQDEKTKIASDIAAATARMNGKKLDIYYVKNEDEESLSYMDFVKDDMSDKYEDVKEPDIKDFQKEEPYESYWGSTYTRTVTDYDGYYAAYDEYNKKQTIERYLTYFEESTYDVRKQSICRYNMDKDESTTIYEGYVMDTAFGGSSTMLYSSVNMESVDKIALSKIMEDSELYYNLYSEIKKMMDEATVHNFVHEDKVVALDVDVDDFGSDVYLVTTVADAKECYFRLYNSEDDEYTLAKTSFSKMDGKVEVVAEEYHSLEAVDDKGVYYLADYKDSLGDLYYGETKIDSDVKSGSVMKMENGKGILYLGDAEDDEYVGTLKLYKGSKAIEIADDASYYTTGAEGGVAVLTDYSFKKMRGTLQVYEGKKLKTVDEDVNYILYY